MAIVTIEPGRGAMRCPVGFGASISIGAFSSPVALNTDIEGGNPENYQVPARRNLALLVQNQGDDPCTLTIASKRRSDGVFLRARTFTVPADGVIYGLMLDPAYAGNALRLPVGLTNLLPAAGAGQATTWREVLLVNGDFEGVSAGALTDWTITQPDPTGEGEGAITFQEGDNPDTNRVTFVQPSDPDTEGYMEADASPWAGESAVGIVVEISRFFFEPGASGKGTMRVAWTETPGDVEFIQTVDQGGDDMEQDGASVLVDVTTVSRLEGTAGTFQAGDFFRLGCESAFYPEEITSVQVWRPTEVANYARRWVLDTAEPLAAAQVAWAWYRLTLNVGLSPDPFMEGEAYRVRVELRNATTNALCFIARDHRYPANESAFDITFDFPNGGAVGGIGAAPLRLVVEIQKEPAEGTVGGGQLISATLVRLDDPQTAGPGMILLACDSEECQMLALDLDVNPGAFTTEFSQ